MVMAASRCLGHSVGGLSKLKKNRRDPKCNSSFVDAILGKTRLTSAAHFILSQTVKEGDLVVDATCGNGHDSVYLAKLIGSKGSLYSFDIQPDAISSTKWMLAEELGLKFREVGCDIWQSEADNPATKVIKRSHEEIESFVPVGVKAIVFNLGYLPGGLKHIITQKESTLAAVRSAMNLIQTNGIVSVMAYRGHEGGMEEHKALQEFYKQLSANEWSIHQIEQLNREISPVLTVISKK